MLLLLLLRFCAACVKSYVQPAIAASLYVYVYRWHVVGRVCECRSFFFPTVSYCVCWPNAQTVSISFARSVLWYDSRVLFSRLHNAHSIRWCRRRRRRRTFDSCMSVFIARFSLSATINWMCFELDSDFFFNSSTFPLYADWPNSVCQQNSNSWSEKGKFWRFFFREIVLMVASPL